METDKYLTLTSETHNSSNFAVNFWPYLTFGDDWEVALVQAYIPQRDSHFADTFKAYFPNNNVVRRLSVHYNTSPTATSSASRASTVRIDDIIDGIGQGTTKLDVLEMIYTVAWNKIMYDIKTDASLMAAYPKDKNGNVLHQIAEEGPYSAILKGYGQSGGRFTLDKTLAQMMGIMNVGGTALGSGVHYTIRGNENIVRVSTYIYNNDEINLYSDVDWVFTTLLTPWSTRYIPEKAYKHVDINCDLIVSQQVNIDNKYILYHAEIPGDGGVVVPHERVLLETAQC